LTSTAAGNDALVPFTQTLITNFTVLTAVVVSAYFGIEAIRQWRQATAATTTTGNERASTRSEQSD
jgi:hypothetical protein